MPYNIIPLKAFPTERGTALDKKAIAFWFANGFMLEDDSFWEDVKWERPTVDGPLWFYQPRERSFDDVVEEFADLFETIVREHLDGKKAILPLSGGLDSRSLAVALHRSGIETYGFSYRFAGSFAETKYGKELARIAGWEFDAFDIPPSYLWDKIEEAGRINGCYAEFTHARQVAVAEEISKKGDIWVLGHWGDVLFDDMGVSDNLAFDDQVKVLYKKVLKKGGKEIAGDLWSEWDLEGAFDQVLNDRLSSMLGSIDIENANARIRAFKSKYWATRWTTTNLSFFGHWKPMSLPYYDDRMCRFICSVPEKYLAGRQVQLEYIRRYAPKMAAVPWQDKEPYNLFNYHHHRTSRHLPYRITQKFKRTWDEKVLGKKLILRNWENQFLGGDNPQHLESWLFENPKLLDLVPKPLIQKYYDRFLHEDPVFWSHPVSMLLTLSVFAKENL